MTAKQPPPFSDRRQIEAWIDAARNGSDEALGELLGVFRLYLLSIAYEKTSPYLQAKVSPSDLVQETSLAAHRGFGDFRGRRLEELLAWLREIMLCTASNTRRHYCSTEKRQVSRERSLEDSPEAGRLCDDIPSPRSLLVHDEERLLVEQALARLPDDYRRVVLLRSREHRSFDEIAALMDRSPAAARKLWMRAAERLERECSHDHRQ